MKNIKISLNEKGIPTKKYLDSLHRAFKIPLANGCRFGVAEMALEEFEKVRKQYDIISISFDGELAAFLVCKIERSPFFSRRRCYIYIEVVDPCFSGNKFGDILQNYVFDYAKEQKCSYVYIQTSLSSKWNVERLVNRGFSKWKLRSCPNTDYYSIVFRKGIKDNFLFDKFIYFFSHGFCLLCYNKMGEYTFVGKVLAKPIIFLKQKYIQFRKTNVSSIKE